MILAGTQRHLFDIPPGIAYFNTAYNSPLLNAARDRLTAAAAAKSHPWERTAPDFFDDAERIRALAGRIFGTPADTWAIIPAASYGLSTVARALEPQLTPRDRILLMAEEFPSNVLPWRRTAYASGATIDTVKTPPDGDWTGAVLEALQPGVRIAALSPSHWTNGASLGLAAVGARCRQVGAVLVLDATQSLGAAPLDFAEADPDFVIAAGYKWLLCPYGFGLMYVAPRHHGARPLEETWLARTGSEDFAGLVNYSDAYRPGARRFDVGETCVGTILQGAIAALEQLETWGVAAIAESLADLNGRIAERLQALGFGVPDAARRSPHMFGATLPDHVSSDLVATLRTNHVHISRRGRALRFAPHLHVTPADLEQLLEALERAVHRPSSA